MPKLEGMNGLIQRYDAQLPEMKICGFQEQFSAKAFKPKRSTPLLGRMLKKETRHHVRELLNLCGVTKWFQFSLQTYIS